MAVRSLVLFAGILGALAVVPLALTGCKREQGHTHGPPRAVSSAPPVVALRVGERVAQVDLRQLPTEELKGRPVVRLSRVWEAGGLPGGRPARLDFAGDDGFRPGSKPKCPERLAGSLLERGFLDPVTRDLTWDEALALPGCYRVRGVATIEGSGG